MQTWGRAVICYRAVTDTGIKTSQSQAHPWLIVLSPLAHSEGSLLQHKESLINIRSQCLGGWNFRVYRELTMRSEVVSISYKAWWHSATSNPQGQLHKGNSLQLLTPPTSSLKTPPFL